MEAEGTDARKRDVIMFHPLLQQHHKHFASTDPVFRNHDKRN